MTRSPAAGRGSSSGNGGGSKGAGRGGDEGTGSTTQRPIDVLLVEDDPDVRRAISAALTRLHGIRVTGVETASAALDALRRRKWDRLVLDVALPDRNGLALLADVRVFLPYMPVIVSTAQDSPADRRAAFHAGADEFIAKPLDIETAVIRIEAAQRRGPPHTLRVADVVLDLYTHEMRRGQRLIVLSPRQFRVLSYLMKQWGEIVTKDDLRAFAWRGHLPPKTRAYGNTVGSVQRALTAAGEQPLLHSLWNLRRRQGVARRADAGSYLMLPPQMSALEYLMELDARTSPHTP